MNEVKAVLDRGLAGFVPTAEAYARTSRRVARRQRRRRAGAAAVAVVVTAGGLLGAWVAFRPAPIPPAPSSRTTITGTFRVPAGVSDVAYGFDSLWAPGRDVVTRVDPSSSRIVATIAVPGTSDYRYVAVDEVAAERAVWVTDSGKQAVYRLDPESNQVVARIHLRGTPVGVLAVPGSVLVSTEGGGLLRIDPTTNEVRSLTHTGSRTGAGSLGYLQGQGGVAAGDGQVWVIDALGNRLDRIDPVTGRILGAIPYDPRFGTPAIAFGSAWVPDHPFLLRIDLRSGGRQAAISFLAPVALGADPHGVWVLSAEAGAPERATVQLIDPRTNATVGFGVQVEQPVVGFAVGHGAAWIADFSGPAIIRAQVLPAVGSK